MNNLKNYDINYFMKISTWNVNSVRARLPLVLNWLRDSSPDVVLLQETKVVDELFPREEIEDLGYNIVVAGQKSYNGVAILSKFPLDDVITELPTFSENPEARYIEAVICSDIPVRVASVYVPNGMEVGSQKFKYKLEFLDKLHEHLQALLEYDECLAVGGDYNIAPEEIDVHNPEYSDGRICFHPEERKRFRIMINGGLIDAFRAKYPDRKQYTWWDYRTKGWENGRGMRLDHFLISPQMADIVADVVAEEDTRGLPKPSDHCPLSIQI